ncbi:MAG TPA: NRAMP family divalent metal transporter [Planctomycetota bacterium]|jgi:Mn2+/Fe2+ NRAMP family transporter|nr:NRAMP family divalent metal transporter [Planctomycetota bacterium]
MATSAIGPGFLTQTALFTERLAVDFGFVILASVVLSLVAQVNVWRVLVASGMRGPEVANRVLPGLGHSVTALVVAGGLAFNVGNLGGAGLGLNVLFGWRAEAGAVATAAVTLGLFFAREAGRAVDRFSKGMGFVLIGLMAYLVATTSPPAGRALVHSVAPGKVSLLPIVTLVGGTVGGYITFAGAHRLLDAGMRGGSALPGVTRSAFAGIFVVALVRVLLFLTSLAVVASGRSLDPADPAASVFRIAAGEAGYRILGVVLWAAAATSVVGCAYTSASFLRTLARGFDRRPRTLVAGFIAVSTIAFLAYGKPVRILVLAGALNGLILPVTLSSVLVAAHRRDVVGDYRHPRWMTLAGALVAVATAWLGGAAIVSEWREYFE